MGWRQGCLGPATIHKAASCGGAQPPGPWPPWPPSSPRGRGSSASLPLRTMPPTAALCPSPPPWAGQTEEMGLPRRHAAQETAPSLLFEAVSAWVPRPQTWCQGRGAGVRGRAGTVVQGSPGAGLPCTASVPLTHTARAWPRRSRVHRKRPCPQAGPDLPVCVPEIRGSGGLPRGSASSRHTRRGPGWRLRHQAAGHPGTAGHAQLRRTPAQLRTWTLSPSLRLCARGLCAVSRRFLSPRHLAAAGTRGCGAGAGTRGGLLWRLGAPTGPREIALA